MEGKLFPVERPAHPLNSKISNKLDDYKNFGEFGTGAGAHGGGHPPDNEVYIGSGIHLPGANGL